jgi:hypothetical protein
MWRIKPDEKEGLPKGETGPDKHLDDADPASSRVVPNGEGQFWSGEETYVKAAATMSDLASRTSREVHSRARQVKIRLKRADPDKGNWHFQAAGSEGRTYNVKVKGVRKGNLKDLGKLHVLVSCDCDFFRFQGPEHWGRTEGFLLGKPRGTATTPTEKDPRGKHWACKHVLAALNLARRYKISSEINGETLVIPEWPDPGRVAGRFLARGR